MLEQAGQLNDLPEKIHFHLNVQPDLRAFADNGHDFVLSLIALQHTPSRFQFSYMKEFVRILRPGGVAVFNVMIPRQLWRTLVPEWFVELWRSLRAKGKACIPIYPVSDAWVREAIATGSGEVIDMRLTPVEEPYSHRLAYAQYVVRKTIS